MRTQKLTQMHFYKCPKRVLVENENLLRDHKSVMPRLQKRFRGFQSTCEGVRQQSPALQSLRTMFTVCWLALNSALNSTFLLWLLRKGLECCAIFITQGTLHVFLYAMSDVYESFRGNRRWCVWEAPPSQSRTLKIQRYLYSVCTYSLPLVYCLSNVFNNKNIVQREEIHLKHNSQLHGIASRAFRFRLIRIFPGGDTLCSSFWYRQLVRQRIIENYAKQLSTSSMIQHLFENRPYFFHTFQPDVTGIRTTCISTPRYVIKGLRRNDVHIFNAVPCSTHFGLLDQILGVDIVCRQRKSYWLNKTIFPWDLFLRSDL